MGFLKHAPPIQYQRGFSEFYKLKFKLTQDVLIPRPETELLVDEVLKYVRHPELEEVQWTSESGSRTDGNFQENEFTIIDVGTGSGCIAISIVKNTKNVKVFAIDISPAALEIAKQNAKFHKVEKRVVFLENNLVENIKTSPDIIVANLPYIPSAKLLLIDPLVKDFEPKLALDGGVDGFELYRKMFAQIRDQNIFPKVLLGEIDEDQGEIAKSEGRHFFPNAKKIEILKDLAKRDRFFKIVF